MKAVTIMLHDDGSFMVSEEEIDAPMEGGGGETFASAEEACDAALSMLRGRVRHLRKLTQRCKEAMTVSLAIVRARHRVVVVMLLLCSVSRYHDCA